MTRALILTAFVAGMVGCAARLPVVTTPVASGLAGPRPFDTTGVVPRVEPATVQVRNYSFSPTVSIVAWADAENEYGLRSSLRRDGSLVTEHRLYVNTFVVPDGRRFTQAVTPTRPLRLAGISRDIYACYGTGGCSPWETFGARIPDAFLRANRDSIAVTFYGPNGHEMAVTVRRDLIDAYLGVVDSVSAALRKM